MHILEVEEKRHLNKNCVLAQEFLENSSEEQFVQIQVWLRFAERRKECPPGM